MVDAVKDNPLGVEKINVLIRRFAIPSIIAMVVGACYNIVDQLFIGNMVGELGNAATNVVFPMTNLCLAVGLMLGTGGAAAFNLTLGSGDKEKAPYYLGNAVTMLLISGVVFALIAKIFLYPILNLFGAPTEVVPYAADYLSITAIGFPFFIFSAGAGHLIRADGRPNVIMMTNIIGAVINIGLDSWFVIGLKWGMSGAAWATIIGQFVAALIQFWFLLHPKTLKMSLKHYVPKLRYFGRDAKLGIASCVNQLALMVVQIFLNNAYNYYGALSIYGSATPIAVAGILMKVASIYMGVIIGISQGNQPILSFNYGAKNFRRVKEAYYRCCVICFCISIFVFAIFQIFPDTILGFFGSGSPEYFEFGRKFFRIYMLFIWLFFIQILTSTMFNAIGKPWKGMFLSLTRQVIFFLPLLFLFSYLWGIEGIIYVMPVADVLSITLSLIMLKIEFNRPGFREEKGVLKEIITRKPAEGTAS